MLRFTLEAQVWGLRQQRLSVPLRIPEASPSEGSPAEINAVRPPIPEKPVQYSEPVLGQEVPWKQSCLQTSALLTPWGLMEEVTSRIRPQPAGARTRYVSLWQATPHCLQPSGQVSQHSQVGPKQSDFEMRDSHDPRKASVSLANRRAGSESCPRHLHLPHPTLSGT